MSHTYQLPAHFCHTNGSLRWLPSQLVDQYFPLLLLCPQQQQQQQQRQQQHIISANAHSSSSSSSSGSSAISYLLMQHQVPAGCCCNTGCCNTPSCYRSVIQRSKHNVSDRLAGASHATAAVLTPGSTTTRMKVNVAATFGQNMSPVWANIRTFIRRSVRTEPGKNVNPACIAKTARTVLCTPTTRDQGLDQTFVHGPQRGVEAGSRREQQISTDQESVRRGYCRGIYPIQKTTAVRPHRCSCFVLVYIRNFGSGPYLIATVNRSSDLFSTTCRRAGPCLGTRKPVGRLMGRAGVVVVVL